MHVIDKTFTLCVLHSCQSHSSFKHAQETLAHAKPFHNQGDMLPMADAEEQEDLSACAPHVQYVTFYAVFQGEIGWELLNQNPAFQL